MSAAAVPASAASAARSIGSSTAGAYGFAVGIFAIEVWFAAVFLFEIASTLTGDGFFRLGTWGTGLGALARESAFALWPHRRHFGALLSKDRLT